jgi:hypothetical protein
MRTVCPIQPAIDRVKRESENTRKTPNGNRLMGEFISRGASQFMSGRATERNPVVGNDLINTLLQRGVDQGL